MSENLERSLNQGIKEDPYLKDMPTYAKKDRIKNLINRQCDAIASLSMSKQLGRGLDHASLADSLKYTYDHFQEQYKEIKRLSEENAELNAKLEKQTKEANMTKNLKEGLTTKYHEIFEQLKEEEVQSAQKTKKYMDEKQAVINAEQEKYNKLRDQQLEQEGRNKFLKEKKEKVFSQVDEFIVAKTKLLEARQQELTQIEDHISQSMKGLLNVNVSDTPEVKEAEEFTKKYSADYEKILELWDKVNAQPDQSIVMIESISSKIPKLRDLKAQINKEVSEVSDKLKDNLSKLMTIVNENATLRASIEAEQSRSATLEKLFEDLKMKAEKNKS